jgi:hypothetical protein
VVHKVIGALAVARVLGARLVPALVVIRPTDLTKIAPLPLVMLAFSAVVPEEWMEIGPLVELKDPVPV